MYLSHNFLIQKEHDKTISKLLSRARKYFNELYHIQGAGKQQLEKMQAAGYLKPVNYLTPWISRFVIVEQITSEDNLILEYALDHTNLNKTFESKPIYYWTPDETYHKLPQGKVFTIHRYHKRNIAILTKLQVS